MPEISLQTQASLLEQAFEESRYHRNFHHFVFHFIITLYTALLGFQIANPFKPDEISIQLLVLYGLIFYIVLPFYFRNLILKYHITISKLNIIINDIIKEMIKHDDSSFDYNKSVMNISPELFQTFTFYKYKKAITGLNDNLIDKKLANTGRGHKFFIKVSLYLVVINLAFTILTYLNIG